MMSDRKRQQECHGANAGVDPEATLIPQLKHAMLVRLQADTTLFFLCLWGRTSGPFTSGQLFSQAKVRQSFFGKGLYLPKVSAADYEDCLRDWIASMTDWSLFPRTSPKGRVS
jgi:hypothetical protein